MSSDETPSFSTLTDILHDAVVTWYNCRPYAISPWAVEFLFYMSLCFILFYLYVILTILIRRVTKGLFNNPFYNCVMLLSIGDIGTLLTCSRATIPTCALRGIPARYLAWEGLGVFYVDLIYGINLVMASIRLNAVYFPKKTHTRRISTWLLNGFLLVELVWAIAMGALYYTGTMRRIWFEGTKYRGEWKFPFNHRTEFNMGQMALTFILYGIAFFRLRKLKVSLSSTSFRQEYRLLILAFLIFGCELFFIYSSDWIGFNWGLGDADFNANVAYFGRPLATGITPVSHLYRGVERFQIFYLIFASEVRNACFPCTIHLNNKSSASTYIQTPRRTSVFVLKP